MPLTMAAFKKLRRIVGRDYCSNTREDLVCYAYDATSQVFLPDAVVFPDTAEQVSGILKTASQEGFFVVPRGSGSGMTGGSLATEGGVILATSRLNRIIEIDENNMTARVEPGVVTGHFHKEVEKKGLFYPPDPSSSEFSTLGGNLAECAGGPRAVKYGVTRDYVLGLEAVLPTGEIIHTGSKTIKGVVGYDLTRLIIGSEGTLGVITGMTLRLIPLPETVRTMTAVFDRIDNAAETVSEIIKSGVIPRTIEFMDNTSIICAENRLKVGLPVEAEALLLIETDGRPDEADASMQRLCELCKARGAAQVNIADTDSEAANLWKARRAVSPALFQYGPDKINEDIVVPRNRIPDMVRKVREMQRETGLTIASFGHAGDGNIHINIMLNKEDVKALATAESAVESIFDYTLELGGTISGEHGIGITKLPYIEKEINAVELDLMKKIKESFDPKNILNPGKIFFNSSAEKTQQN